MIGSIIQLGSSLEDFGRGKRRQLEGAGSYDLTTGKFKNPKKVGGGYMAGQLFAPHKAFFDPNVSTKGKIAAALGIGWTGIGKRDYIKNLEAEYAKQAQKYDAIEQKIQDLPDYEIAPEAQQKLALLEATGDRMTGLAEEATQVAESREGEEIPGAAIIRDDIAQNTAQQIEAAQMSGNAMAIIPLIGGEQQSQYRELAKENMAYREQASKDVQKAMMSEAQVGAQAVGLEAEGLSGMISEKGKAYQSELDKAITGIDFNITRKAQEQLGWQAAQESRAAQTSGLTNALSNVASSYFANKGNSGGFGSNKTPIEDTAPTAATAPSTPKYGADAPVTEGTPLNVKEGYGGYY